VTQVDEKVLKHLEKEEWSSPEIMAREHYKKLQWVGSAYPLHSDTYEITTDGKQYLEGELTCGIDQSPHHRN